MVEIVPMNFISYQKLVKMVKDVCYSKGLSYELALEMGFSCRVLPRPLWHSAPLRFKKFDMCHYALKSPIRFNLIPDTAWC